MQNLGMKTNIFSTHNLLCRKFVAVCRNFVVNVHCATLAVRLLLCSILQIKCRRKMTTTSKGLRSLSTSNYQLILVSLIYGITIQPTDLL